MNKVNETSVDSVEPFIARLKSKNASVRQIAAAKLGAVGGKQAVEPLIEALEDPTIKVALAAATTLGELGDPRAVEPLVKMSRSGRLAIREASKRALRKLRARLCRNYRGDGGSETAFLVSKLYNWWGHMRPRILSALGKTRDPKAIGFLLPALSHKKVRVRKHALEALGNIPGAVLFALPTAAGDPHPGVAEKAAGLLRNTFDRPPAAPPEKLLEKVKPKVFPLLLAALDHEDFNVRTAALRGLGLYRTPHVVDAVAGALKHPFRETRIEAVKALAQIGDTRAVQPLRGTLEDPSPAVRLETLKALGGLDHGGARQALIAALADENPEAGDTVRRMVFSLGGDAAPYLEEALAKGRPKLKEAVLGYCEWSGDPRMTGPLCRVLKKVNPDSRVRIVKVLGNSRDTAAVEPLCDLLTVPGKAVREAAAEALGNLGDKEAVAPLGRALKDKKWSVRARAARALGRLGDKAAVEPLATLLGGMEPTWTEDETGRARRQAVLALGRLSDARAVEPLLQLSATFDREAVEALEILSFTLPKKDSDMLCGKCFTHVERYRKKMTLVSFLQNFSGGKLSYVACRQCHSNTFLLEGIKKIILLLDRNFKATSAREKETLVVNGLKTGALIDADEIHIRNAQDYDIRKLVLKLKNDTDDRRRKRLADIPVVLSPHLDLSPAVMNMLRDNFRVSLL